MENQRRLTVALEEGVYVKLIDYAAEMSKQKMSRFSLSEALRELVAKALEQNERAARGERLEGRRTEAAR